MKNHVLLFVSRAGVDGVRPAHICYR
ncbi:hypothetical protein RHCRD62_20334 [Rhodococcus sp. RD6.2]|nr:hypothetical protein RHCRD62_20334 [Rhodococcus sp. RD6.2]